MIPCQIPEALLVPLVDEVENLTSYLVLEKNLGRLAERNALAHHSTGGERPGDQQRLAAVLQIFQVVPLFGNYRAEKYD